MTTAAGRNAGRFLMLSASLLAFGLAGRALAQDAAASSGASSGDTRDAGGARTGSKGLEDIVVTARKREERLQDAPLAIVAVSASMLAQQNVNRVEDINRLTPNLTIETGAGVGSGASFVLRGIGAFDYELYSDPPVSLYVDGVLYARPHTWDGEMFDLERIEVLYGPQGTLFGRNTTGGAVSIITKQPTKDFHLEQRVGYGNNNEFNSRTILNTGEIGHTGLSAKFGYYHRQMDGWQRDLNTDKAHSPGSRDTDAFIAQLHGDVAPDLTFDYRFDHRHITYRPTAYEIIDPTPDFLKYFSASPNYGGQPFLYITNKQTILRNLYQNNAFPASQDSSGGHSLTINYSPSREFNIKNIAAYRRMSVAAVNDPGGQGFLLGPVLDPVTFQPAGIAPITPLSAHTRDRQHQYSDELQVTGTIGRLNYVLGGFFFEEVSHGSQFVDLTFVLPGGEAAINSQTGKIYYLKTKSYAGYGQASYRPPILGDRLEITGGLRYTRDEKSFSQDIFTNGVQTDTQALRKSWDNVSFLVSATYKVDDNINIYGRYATGYRSGGFNPGTVQPPYNPEHAKTIEVGLKSDLFDRHLQFNLALFHTLYNDLQTSQVVFTENTQSNEILNAATARYQGGEVQMSVIPAEGFRLDFNAGYIDPKYKKFVIEDPTSHLPIDISNTAHFQLLSKFNFGIGGQYEIHDTPIGDLTFRTDYAYRTKRYWFASDELNPRNSIVAGNPVHDLSASVSIDNIHMRGANLRLQAHGANLLNQSRVEAGTDLGALGYGFVTFARTRNYGIDATLSF